ncbi:MAG: deaminase [Nocardioidaceae bacterium]
MAAGRRFVAAAGFVVEPPKSNLPAAAWRARARVSAGRLWYQPLDDPLDGASHLTAPLQRTLARAGSSPIRHALSGRPGRGWVSQVVVTDGDRAVIGGFQALRTIRRRPPANMGASGNRIGSELAVLAQDRHMRSAVGPGLGAMRHPLSFDDRAMTLAIEQAKLAASSGELPYGAVVVDPDGVVLGAAHDTVVSTHDLTAHAEILAVRQATTSHGWLAGAAWSPPSNHAPCAFQQPGPQASRAWRSACRCVS